MDSSKTKTGRNLVVQGSILALASIIVRLIGIVYRIPLTNIVGNEGMGYYGFAFEVYQILVILSTSAIPVAVSKLTAARVAKREYKNAQRIFRCSIIFAAVLSGTLALITFVGARQISSFMFGGITEVAPALRVLAPTVFVCAVMGVFRGYTQGLGNMAPTGLSQVVEQIFNAIVSVAAAAILISRGAAYGAAGGTMGTFMGAVSSLVFLYFVYAANRKGLNRRMKKDPTKKLMEDKEIYRLIGLTVIPLILTSTIYQISSLLDSALFSNILKAIGYQSSFISSLYGIYSSKYQLLINLPLGITSALSVAMMPGIAGAIALNRKDQVREQMDMVIRMTMLIAIPCAVGVAVMGGPIMQMLFNDATTLPGRMLIVGAVTIIFYALSTLTSTILQASNHMRVPVINAAISLGVHIVFTVVLLAFANLHIFALIYGNIVFSFCMCVLNLRSLAKLIDYRLDIQKMCGATFVASVIMGVVTFLVYKGCIYVIHSNILSTLIAIIIAVVVYALFMVLTRGVTEDELYMFPKGETLVRILYRMHLL
ncbi:putative polysaccharide biosynthesis protein [Frisingicoccus sp.]|uniref:putative polysaccharide biosynthesis protein n=1 Tax=Frisingicoccus sp. TaxID=1918627 RepID=UPI002A82B387|nr:polysaccharide biosynthesis protein [Frisingicoccus sp.]MDY4835672.1 polysaccharide biosynthesis protein [Frisingicoccus sp.]MDY4921665.1 polysaccharide biosynthesis protein [Frisingicoccus sp.]